MINNIVILIYNLLFLITVILLLGPTECNHSLKKRYHWRIVSCAKIRMNIHICEKLDDFLCSIKVIQEFSHASNRKKNIHLGKPGIQSVILIKNIYLWQTI